MLVLALALSQVCGTRLPRTVWEKVSGGARARLFFFVRAPEPTLNCPADVQTAIQIATSSPEALDDREMLIENTVVRLEVVSRIAVACP